ncbi:cation:proton antiporter [Acetobacter fallax]|uniref:Sodium:proton antiporter n=1 Tax=Acetobacter fallax TaxID=1737473 RepID=A0ABX0KF81_9PROT|nr:sodium:proton antiporter [Acetobacter fallax]NHO33783.1 sodium:proton antiporter [Acetobacter fallax]NHO37344.1 sodium:proton antiporter [Acetobacter fallax]
MSTLGVLGFLFTLSTLFALINYWTFRLPITIGVMVIALLFSLGLLAAGPFIPIYDVHGMMLSLLGTVDLPTSLLDGALSMLLFAGAMQVNPKVLLSRRVPVAVLALAGTILAVLILAMTAWLLLPLVGMPVPLSWCVILGAILAPTDPVSVVGMLRRAGLPAPLQAVFAGESLFNDGIGIVVFGATIGLATGDASHVTTQEVIERFLLEACGGAALGALTGVGMLFLVRKAHDHDIDLLASLALATGTYSLAHALHMSGPIAVVVAGMSLATEFGQSSMQDESRAALRAFWSTTDEALNVLLFLLIGLEILAVSPGYGALAGMLVVIVLSLVARGLSVGLAVLPLDLRRDRRAIAVLIWGGLRGGISVALALGLPAGALRDTLLPLCYGVVVFTIVVQGLTMERVAKRLYP